MKSKLREEMAICAVMESEDEIMEDEKPTSVELDSGFYSAYEAREMLGRGLASMVRRCIEKSTGQVFAVKIVDVSTERQTEHEARRLREETLVEVQLLRELAVQIHDFFATPTFLFEVLEMAPKGELFEYLNQSVTFNERKTRSIMKQLFDGVNFMHNRNIVHRDLKLENILCIDDNRIVISDFGFARQLKSGQKLRELFGTPGYLAPETLRCQMYEDAPGYSLEVDNWALGVIMYTLLAGYAPFYHRQQLRMMRMIQEGRFDFPKEQWDTVSDDAKGLIRRLLTVDVSRRIKAGECLSHKWMTVGTVVPAPPPAVKPTEKPVIIKKRDYRALFRIGILVVRFMHRIKTRLWKKSVDRTNLRVRPYRNKEIRHEAEAASFAVYGHWVNRGFYYSRDMLFANKPRPKFDVRKQDEVKSNGNVKSY